jgi:hypothetical protein
MLSARCVLSPVEKLPEFKGDFVSLCLLLRLMRQLAVDERENG